jgi:hypothetical protein
MGYTAAERLAIETHRAGAIAGIAVHKTFELTNSKCRAIEQIRQNRRSEMDFRKI